MRSFKEKQIMTTFVRCKAWFTYGRKALGKLGNIVAETFVILDVSSNVSTFGPPVETKLRKQNLLPGKQKCFLPNSETFDVSLCFSLMFPSVCPLWETWRNFGRKQCFRNNVS
jgi:hypothetical protein